MRKLIAIALLFAIAIACETNEYSEKVHPKCSANCEACTSATVCTSCANNFKLASSACVAMGTPPTQCTSTPGDATTDVCGTCNEGYANLSGTCTLMTGCAVVASDCRTAGTHGGSACAAGGNGCLKCSTTTKSTTDCSTDATGSFAGCEGPNADSTACTYCISGSQLTDTPACASTGFTLDAHCATDASRYTAVAAGGSAKACTACETGFYLTAASNSCTAYTAANMANCVTQNPNSDACQVCKPGYILSGAACVTTGVTYVPAKGCMGQTTSVAACDICETGYACSVAAADECTACPAGCKTCTGAEACTACEAMFWLENGLCKACDSSCSACKEADGSCTGCSNEEQELKDGECVDPPADDGNGGESSSSSIVTPILYLGMILALILFY